MSGKLVLLSASVSILLGCGETVRQSPGDTPSTGHASLEARPAEAAGPACPAPIASTACDGTPTPVWARTATMTTCCKYSDDCAVPSQMRDVIARSEASCLPVCVPGTTKPAGDGCNTGRCAPDGTWRYTLIQCDRTPPTVTTQPPGDGGGHYIFGTSPPVVDAGG